MKEHKNNCVNITIKRSSNLINSPGYKQKIINPTVYIRRKDTKNKTPQSNFVGSGNVWISPMPFPFLFPALCPASALLSCYLPPKVSK